MKHSLRRMRDLERQVIILAWDAQAEQHGVVI